MAWTMFAACLTMWLGLCGATVDLSVIGIATVTLQSAVVRGLSDNFTLRDIVGAVSCTGGSVIAITTSSTVFVASLPPADEHAMLSWSVGEDLGPPICDDETILVPLNGAAEVLRVNVTSRNVAVAVGSGGEISGSSSYVVAGVTVQTPHWLVTVEDGALTLYNFDARSRTPFLRSPQDGLSTSKDGFAIGTNLRPPIPEAYTYDPQGVAAVGGLLYFVEKIPGKIRRVELGGRFTVTTICCATRGGTAIDGPFTTAALGFGSDIGIISNDPTVLYLADAESTRLVDLVAERITSYAGSLLGPGNRDGLLDAQFSTPPRFSSWLNYLLVVDKGNSAIRLQQPTVVPMLADASAATALQKANAIFDAAMSTAGATGFVVFERRGITVSVLTDANALTFASAVPPSNSVKFLPVNCGIMSIVDVSDASLLVACATHALYKVHAVTQNVEWFCGEYSVAGYLDFSCGRSRFNRPAGLAFNGTGVAVADSFNRVLRFINTATAAVSTLAGNGTRGRTDGTASASAFDTPVAVTFICGGGAVLYVADVAFDWSAIRKVDTGTGAVVTVAQSPNNRATQDGTQPFSTFGKITSVLAGGGNLFIVDNGALRRVLFRSDAAAITTIAVSNVQRLSAARLTSRGCVSGVELFVQDATSGNISTLEQSMNDASPMDYVFVGPFSSQNRSWPIRDGRSRFDVTIRVGATMHGLTSCPATQSAFLLEDDAIRVWSHGRSITTLAVLKDVSALACDHLGGLVAISTTRHLLWRVWPLWDAPANAIEIFGVDGVPGWDGPFLRSPTHLSSDGRGNVLVSEPSEHRILAISVNRHTKRVLVGDRTRPGISDGNLTIATLFEPRQSAFDLVRQHLYFFDEHLLRIANLESEWVSTLVGRFGSTRSVDGYAVSATFASPNAIMLSGLGRFLYIADGCGLRYLQLGSGNDAVVAHVAGKAADCGSLEASNAVPATVSRFGTIVDVAEVGRGDLLVVDGDRSNLFLLPRPDAEQVLVSPGWGSSCANPPLDATRLEPGTLGQVAGIVVMQSASRNVIAAIEVSGAIRELSARGKILTLVEKDINLFQPRGGCYIAARDELLIANYGRNNIVKVSVTSQLTEVVSGPRFAPFEGGHSNGGPSSARWVGPHTIIVADDDFVVLEPEAHRGRFLSNEFEAFAFIGSGDGRWGNNDGSTSVAWFTQPRAITRTPFSNIYYVAQADRIRRVERFIVTTLPFNNGVSLTSGLVDGPAPHFCDLRGLVLQGRRLIVLDGDALRDVDPVDGTTLTLLGAANTTASHDESALRSAGILTAANSTLILASSDCRIRQVKVHRADADVAFSLARFSSPSISRTRSVVMSSSKSVSVTRTQALTVTSAITRSFSIVNSETESEHRTSATISATLQRNLELIRVTDDVYQSNIISPTSRPELRRVVFALLGTRIDTANASDTSWSLQIYQRLSFDVVTVLPETSRFSFALRRPQLVDAGSVAANSTHLSVTLNVDPHYFTSSDELVQVTLAASAMVSRLDGASGRFVIVSPRSQAQDRPVERVAKLSAAAGAAAGALFSLHAAFGALAHRTSAIQSLQKCLGGRYEKTALELSPVQVRLGDGPLDHHRSTIVFNPVLVLAFLLVQFIVTDYMRYYSSRPRRYCMGVTTFPSLAVVPAMYFLQPTMTAAWIMVVYETEVAWRVVGACALFVIVAGALLLFVYFGAGFRSVFTVDEHATGRRPPWLYFVLFGDGYWEDHPCAPPGWMHHTHMAGALFAPYRQSREWFLIVEVAVALTTAWAMSRVESGQCLEAAAVTVGVSCSYFLFVLLLRPFTSPFTTSFFLALSAAELIASIFMLVPRVSPTADNEPLLDYGGTLSLSCLYAIAGVGLLYALAAVCKSLRGRQLSIATEMQGAALLELPMSPAPSELTLAPGSLWEDAPCLREEDHHSSDGYLSDVVAELEGIRAVRLLDSGHRGRHRHMRRVRKPANPLQPQQVVPPPAKPHLSEKEYARMVALL
jgi:hypothetical protein